MIIINYLQIVNFEKSGFQTFIGEYSFHCKDVYFLLTALGNVKTNSEPEFGMLLSLTSPP
jgi:hypothetical protein